MIYYRVWQGLLSYPGEQSGLIMDYQAMLKDEQVDGLIIGEVDLPEIIISSHKSVGDVSYR